MLVTVNSRLILEIEIVHDLSCHPRAHCQDSRFIGTQLLYTAGTVRPMPLIDALCRSWETTYGMPVCDCASAVLVLHRQLQPAII